MSIAEGVCTWTDRETGKVLGEAKAVGCKHCQRPVVAHNNRGQAIGKGAHRNSGMDAKHDPGGWCGRCAAQICGPCCDALALTLKCVPFEKRLEQMEGRGRLLKAIGVEP